MQRMHVVCALVVAVLIGGLSSRVMAQGFPWWAFDSVIEEVPARGTLRVGLGMFEPWSVCNAEGELIGFGIDVAARVAEDVGVEVEFARTNWSYDTLNFFNGWIAARNADGWLDQRRRYWFETREWADQVATDPDIVAECDESFQ